MRCSGGWCVDVIEVQSLYAGKRKEEREKRIMQIRYKHEYFEIRKQEGEEQES
jgi:hypothetical protein